ncbi:flagellin [Priestia aryabhattai]|uniref:flagellin N-terminal helical domain-containing protein n=1 Tax=Priestia aryabhattai TaxID=412384 RepID=UPI001C8DD5C6|nr:flagellin [Priestia aryabhattai]MBY0076467.1 flagellin [Priestia aryabhattai]
MRINHNIAALNTYRQFNNANNAQSKSMEKLSSGLRINSAADDAAGLAISEKMRGQIRGLDMASRNAQDGISLIQTAEGGLNETHDILQRMNELATQGANETLSTNDRNSIGDEITQLNSEINRISTATKFNGATLLDGTFGVQLGTSGLAVGSNGVASIDISGAKGSNTYTITSSGAGSYTLTDTTGSTGTQTVTLADGTAGALNFDKFGIKIGLSGGQTAAGIAAATAGGGAAGTIITGAAAPKNIQIGAENNNAQKLGISIAKMDSSAGSLNTTSVNVSSADNSRTAMDTIQNAIDTVSRERSKLGAYQNRLDHTINNLATTSENLTAAESRVRDVDYVLAA